MLKYFGKETIQFIMKIAHIADTHFGKDLKKVNFADHDQPAWLEHFLEDVQKEGVEVVLIAGWGYL